MRIINKKLLAVLLFVVSAGIVNAQVFDDYLTFSMNEVQGTARFSAMGGAFNALGGDFSSLSVNPAGIGVYRTSEVTFTSALSVNKTTNNYQNSSTSDSRTKYGIANLGFVGTFLSGKEKGLVSFNYGVGYNKIMDFNKHGFISANGSASSLIDAYAIHANNFKDDFVAANELIAKGKDPYILTGTHWNTIGALDAGLIKYDAGNDEFYSDALNDGDKVDQSRYVTRNGSVGEYVLSFGGNVSNKVFFGVTVGMQDLRYENFVNHIEVENRGNQGTLGNFDTQQRFYADGFGVNAKFGVIYKPFDAFRIGATIHTPTFFDIDEEYYSDMLSTLHLVGKDVKYESYPYESNIYDYRMQSPFKIGFGMAYVFGERGLVSVDYEMTAYNSLRYRDSRYPIETRNINQDIRNSYRNTSTLRIGAELNVVAGLSVRAGFNYIQSPYKLDYYVATPTEPVKQDMGSFDRYVYSAGLGYRGQVFFADFAYTMNTGKSYYSLYEGTGSAPSYIVDEKENRGRFLLTLGMKF